MITAVRGFKLAAAISAVAVMSAAVILTLGLSGCGGDNGAGPDPKPDGGGEDVWSNVTSFSQVNGSWKSQSTWTQNTQGITITTNASNYIITFNATAKTMSASGTQTAIYSGGNIETLWPNVKANAESMRQQPGITSVTVEDANHSVTFVANNLSQTLTDQQLLQSGFQINQNGTKLRITQAGAEIIYTKQ